MRQIAIFTLFILFVLPGFSQKSTLPGTDIKDLSGKTFNTSEINNDGNPIILTFWATWCKPCIKELDAYNDNMIDWKEETGVKIIAVSVDNARSSARVAPFVNGRGWSNIHFYLDPNQDFKREMNVVNVPHTILLNGDLEVIWQHTSYSEGDEYVLYDKILELTEEKE